jgi:transposase
VAWSEEERPELHHLYRSLDVLADAKDDLEVRLHHRVRDLFHQQLDLVLYDTTSTYFQAPEEDALRRRGHSKDKRPDLPQAVLGLLLSGDGLPIGHELFPGNSYDGNTVPAVLDRLKERFQLRWLIFVGDRGMVSEKNLDALDDAGYDWIVGVRLRTRPQLADILFSEPAPFEPVGENLEVKEVWVEDRRYIVCYNPDQARRDDARRQAVVDRLEARLEQSGVKGLVTRPGFLRFLRVTGEEAVIDLDKVELAQAYKSLWGVERAFRTLKSPLELRPVRHWTESRIRGHVVVCFLCIPDPKRPGAAPLRRGSGRCHLRRRARRAPSDPGGPGRGQGDPAPARHGIASTRAGRLQGPRHEAATASTEARLIAPNAL